MRKRTGVFFVAVGALLWATDVLFRLPTLRALSPVLIVWGEHCVDLLVLLPLMLLFKRKTFAKLTAFEWLGVFFIGAGGSALASVLFTSAFELISPALVIMLQKIQPVIVVLLSSLILREKLPRRFFLWSSLALASGIVMSFPTLDFSFLRKGVNLHARGVLFALSTALIWAISTVLSKRLLVRLPSEVMTFWRFAWGWVALTCILLFAGGLTRAALVKIMEPHSLRALVYMGVVPGIIAMNFYYFGLKRTPAVVATWVELLYPVGAVTLSVLYLHQPFNAIQVISAGVLLFAVTGLTLSSGDSKYG